MAFETVTIGDCTLIRGDCLEVLPTLAAGSVDAVVTDPPYSSGGAFRGDRMSSTRTKYQSTDVLVELENFTGDNRDQRGFLAWASLWMTYALEATASGGMLVTFSDWRQLPTMTDAVQSGGWVWRGIVPWDKVNARPMPNRFSAQCEFAVWATNGPRDFDTTAATYHPGILRELPPKDRVHSTQKPVGVLRSIVQVAKEGETVLDPFMGSGTTGVAAVMEGRKFIGFEKSPHYFATACRRIRRAVQDQRSQLPLEAAC